MNTSTVGQRFLALIKIDKNSRVIAASRQLVSTRESMYSLEKMGPVDVFLGFSGETNGYGEDLVIPFCFIVVRKVWVLCSGNRSADYECFLLGLIYCSGNVLVSRIVWAPRIEKIVVSAGNFRILNGL